MKIFKNFVVFAVAILCLISSSCETDESNRYVVTFLTGDESILFDLQIVYEGEKVSMPEEPARTGYTFDGWYKESIAVNPWDFDNDLVYENVMLHANWQMIEAETFTVSFTSGDPTIEIESQTVLEGDKVIMPENLTLTGFIFDKWYKEPAYLNVWNFENDVVTTDITLYARWIEVIKEVTVTFYETGFSSTLVPKTVIEGEKITKPVSPTRNGFTFEAWYKEKETINLWDFENDIVTDDITLYAKWVKNDYVMSNDEMKLYELIMKYREDNGLHRLQISKSLGYVAQVHVRDLQYNYVKTPECNFHSWSNQGDWTPFCYSADDAMEEFMWNKPGELTSYPGYGYEIALYSAPLLTADICINAFRSSEILSLVILNKYIWQFKTWNAIGIGIYKNYVVVWFGEEPPEDDDV